MLTFKQHLTNESYERAIIELAVLAEETQNEFLEEAVIDKAHHVLTKVGLHASQGKGLIQYALSAGKGVAKLIGAAIRGDKETAIEVAKTVKKEEVLDFLLKLDTASLHLVSGPLHALDAWTGTHFAANLSAAAMTATTAFKKAIETAKIHVHKAIVNAKTKTKILNNISRIEKLTTA